jgi:hypothetical protein
LWNAAVRRAIRVLVSAAGDAWHDVTPDPVVKHCMPNYAKRRWANIRATKHRVRTDAVPAGMRWGEVPWNGAAAAGPRRSDFRVRSVGHS